MNSDCQGHVARNPSKCAPLIIPSSGEQRCAPRTVVSTSLEKSSLTTVDQSYHPTSSIKHEFSRCRPSNDGSPGLEQQELISSSMPGSTSNTPVDVPRSPPRVLSAGTPPVCTDANAPSANNPINSSAISLAPPTPGHPSSNHAEGRPSPAVSQSSPLRLGQLGPNASHVSQLVSRSPTPTHSGISTPSSISSIKHAPHSPVGRSRAVDTATKDNLTRLSSSLLKHLAEAAAAVGTGRIDDGSGTDAGTENGAVEAKRERFPPPPLGKIDDPVTYGINLGITGELVSSGDVEVWEFPDMTKLKVLRDRLIIFMEENRLKQADICRFTGLGAPYLSFMVKDPTISNFSSRRRVEVYSVLQTFFNKIDRKEVTLEDIARLVLLSKATARAANSRRRGASAKLGTVRRGDADKPPVIRRRRRGRPKTLERSREDEFYSSGMKEDEFNFDDFIAGAATAEDYLYSDGGLGGLSEFGWSGGQRWSREGARGIDEGSLSGSLEEWKQKSPASFRDGSFDLMGSANSSGVQTPVGFGSRTTPDPSKDAAGQSSTYYNISEVLQRSQNLFNPQNQQFVLQRLVNAAATKGAGPEGSVSSDQQVKQDGEASESNMTKHEDSWSSSVPESQTEILNALIHNLIHQQPDRPESSSHPFNNLSQTPASQSRKQSFIECGYSGPAVVQSQQLQGSSQPPASSLLRQESRPPLPDLKRIKSAADRPAVIVSSSPPNQSPLASILQAIVGNQGKTQLERSRFGFNGFGTEQPLVQQSVVSSNDSTIKFGRGWIKEVDVGLLGMKQQNSSPRVSEDDVEFSLVALPRSGRICAVRLQWSWDNGSSDEDILWDVNDGGSAIDTFVEAYIRELGLPRNPVGTQLLASFRRQVDTARSFEGMFEAVCQHLQIRLGHPNSKQLPGITRKIIIDCYHEGLRVIDAVTWNLTNSVFEIRMFLRSLIHDLNLPSSFVSILFAAFVRAIAKERLKFIHECGDVLLGNVRTEIAVQNSPEFKQDRKRGHSQGEETIENSPIEGGSLTKRLRTSGPDGSESEKDEKEPDRSEVPDSEAFGDKSDHETDEIVDQEMTPSRSNEEDRSSATADLDEMSFATSSENESEQSEHHLQPYSPHDEVPNSLSQDVSTPPMTTEPRVIPNVIGAGRPIIPLTLKPTALSSNVGGPSRFNGRLVAHPTRLGMPWANNTTAMSSDIRIWTPSQYQSFEMSKESESLSNSSLILRSCSQTVSRATLNEALANPTGLISNQMKTEELPQPMETENRRTTRRSDVGQRDHPLYT